MGNCVIVKSGASGDVVYYNDSIPTTSGPTINADQLQGYSVNNLLKLIYPVGAIYQTTSNSSPANFISGTTWALRSSVALVSEHVFGNGKGLGLTNGTNYGAMFQLNTGEADITTNYGDNVFAGVSGIGNSVPSGLYGSPTKSQLGANPEYSGLIADTITIYTWERTA